jgi:cysteine desulfurase/selenocysteine lyase
MTDRPNDAQTPDWAAIREQFPILRTEVDGRPLAYLDNAASSQMPQRVIDRIVKYQTTEHSNVHRGVHTLSQRATDAFEEARRRVRGFINAPEERECIFVRGATEAINLVMHGFGRKFVQQGDAIVISHLEHHSNIVPWQMLCEEKGAELRVIPMSDDGSLDFEAFEALLDDRVKLLGLVHVSNALGTINDVRRFTDAAHAADIPVLVDGAQAVPHMPVDVQALGADFYAFSGHKMFGPTGAGVLWGKAELLEQMQPFMGGGEMILDVSFEKTTYNVIPHKFEAGTPAIMPVVGLGEAIAFLDELGMENVARREATLMKHATKRVQELDFVRILGPDRRAGVMSLEVEGVHPHDVGTILDQAGVAVRAGHHCAQPVMTRLGVPATARASFAFYNDFSDIDALVEGLQLVKEIFG